MNEIVRNAIMAHRAKLAAKNSAVGRVAKNDTDTRQSNLKWLDSVEKSLDLCSKTLDREVVEKVSYYCKEMGLFADSLVYENRDMGNALFPSASECKKQGDKFYSSIKEFQSAIRRKMRRMSNG